MNTFKLQIAAPDGMRYDGDAVQISVRGIEGDLAVMAGHIHIMHAGEIIPGRMQYTSGPAFENVVRKYVLVP